MSRAKPFAISKHAVFDAWRFEEKLKLDPLFMRPETKKVIERDAGAPRLASRVGKASLVRYLDAQQRGTLKLVCW